MIVVHHSPIIRDLIPQVYTIYYGSVGALIQSKDQPFRRSLKILNSYKRAFLVKRLSILLRFQFSMKYRRRQVVPHQRCIRVSLNICGLRTMIYVSSLLPQISHYLCLLAEKRTTIYQAWVTYFRTHNKFPSLILKVLSRPKILKSRNWLSIHLQFQVAPLLLLYPQLHRQKNTTV